MQCAAELTFGVPRSTVYRIAMQIFGLYFLGSSLLQVHRVLQTTLSKQNCQAY